MKKFILSLTFIVIGVYVVDRIGGMLMWQVNQQTHDVSGPKIKYLVNDVDEEVVLMGTSRCNSHYVPSIIRDTLGMSVYNGGIDASNNIYAHYIMLNHILSHHNPKVICLEVMTSDFAVIPDSYKTIAFFAPYIGKNIEADSIFRLAGKYYQYKFSHLYRYNSKAFSNIAGLLVNRHAGGEMGYIPRARSQYMVIELKNGVCPEKVDSQKIYYLKRFIDMCEQHGVRLVFMISPAYEKVDYSYYKVVREIAKENDIPLLDYHTKGLFLDEPELFYDEKHLWDEGARRYSSIFASDLKKVMCEE